jgi:hypothetical protein
MTVDTILLGESAVGGLRRGRRLRKEGPSHCSWLRTDSD